MIRCSPRSSQHDCSQRAPKLLTYSCFPTSSACSIRITWNWVTAISWLMVAQVVISQGLVWAAIVIERSDFYYYEELGWGLIFFANMIASAYLYVIGSVADKKVLLQLNLLFGIVYLPWQVIHLTALRA